MCDSRRDVAFSAFTDTLCACAVVQINFNILLDRTPIYLEMSSFSRAADSRFAVRLRSH